MLTTLEIKNFALIEQVCVPWTYGLNVLTGETGAGKSVLIDALNAVLGGKVGPTAIRSGAERAIIEAVFSPSVEMTNWLTEQELIGEDPTTLIISREISKSGSRFRINGVLVNQSLVQDLRQRTVTIHAQHEARTLTTPASQLQMLDNLGDAAHQNLVDRVRILSGEQHTLTAKLKDCQISEAERARRLDFARFQLNELLEANLSNAGEIEEVSNHCRMLAHISQLENAVLSCQEHLTGEHTSASEAIGNALLALRQAAQLDENLNHIVETLNNCLTTVDETTRDLRRYHDKLDTDPESLARLESRLSVLINIQRKYGPSLADAIKHQDELAAEVDQLDSMQSVIDKLQFDLSATNQELLKAAGQLSDKRKKLAIILSKQIQKELFDLGMERCRFEIALTQTTNDGTPLDRVEFLIAPNPGQPLLPVAKIASGGELSRVMLAIKSIFATADRIDTVIFDEIDTGLSGKTLQSMRDKLAHLARNHQILCITHQPMIASVATNHLLVSKLTLKNSTSVKVTPLNLEDRVKSLAGMASGEDNQEDALRFAQSLFNEAAHLRAV